MTFSIKRKTLKKIVSSLTMFATVVSMSGFMALSTVVAADAIADGALIKSNATNSDGTPTLESLDVYIVKLVEVEGEDTKMFKRLMLNPTVFESYEHLSWGDIQTVSQDVMDKYTISSLVRVDTDLDEKVYAMAPNGDIGSKSWVNLTSTDFLSLAASENGDSIYTINAVDGGNYTAVGDVTTVVELTTFYTAGTLPEAAVEPVPVPVTGLTVGLSSDTPSATSIVTGGNGIGAQALIPMLNLNFTASTSGDAQVDTVKIKRAGLMSDTYVLNAYLFDGETKVAQMYSISAGVVTFTDAGGIFTVPAGTTKTISVKMDLEDSAAGGNTVGFTLNSADDITSDATSVTGSYPIVGNQMSVASLTDLGQLTVGTTVLAGGSTGINPQDEYELFKSSFASTNQDLEISYLKLSNVGSTSVGDIKNLKLMISGVQYGTTVAQENSDGEVIFDLSDNPISLTSGQSKVVSLFGDIKAGSSRTFQYSIQNSSDIVVVDQMYNVNLFPIASGVTPGIWSVVKTTTADTIAPGSIAVVKSTDSPSGTVADGSTGVTLGKWDFKATGEAVKVNTLSFSYTSTLNVLKNIKIYLDDAAVGTSTATGSSGTTYVISMGNALVIPAGETKYVTIKADLTDTTIVDADTVVTTLILAAGNAQAQTSKTSLSAPGSSLASNTITVTEGTLVLSKDQSYGSQSVVTPSSATLLGQYTLSTGTAESIDLSTISVTFTEGSGLTVLTELTDVYVKYGTDTTTTKAASAATAVANTWSISKNMAANSNMTIKIYGNIASTTGTVVPTVIISGTTSSSTNAVNTGTAVGGQTITAVSGGTLTVELDNTTPAASLVVAGTQPTDGSVKLKLTGTNEIIYVNQIKFRVDADTDDVTIASVDLYAGASASMAKVSTTKTWNIDSTNPGYVSWTLAGTDRIAVPKNGSTYVMAMPTYVSSGQDSTVSGKTPALFLADIEATGNAALTPSSATPNAVNDAGIIIKSGSSATYVDSGANTLTTALLPAVSTLVTDNAKTFLAGDIIFIDEDAGTDFDAATEELMVVLSQSAGTLTVERGAFGTTAGTYTVAKNIYRLSTATMTTTAGIVGNATTVVLTKPTLSLAAGNPSGASSGGNDKVIFKFTVTADNNAADTAENKVSMTQLDLTTTKSGVTVTDVKIYPEDFDQNSVYAVTASGLSTTDWRFDMDSMAGSQYQVLEGQSKTFVVRADVGAGTAASNSLEVAISSLLNGGDVTWSDNGLATSTNWVNQPGSTDLAGNAITYGASASSAYNDTTAPTISTIVVTNGATADTIDAGDTIVITFSEMIDPSIINASLIPGSSVAGVSSGTGHITANTGDAVITIANITTFDSGTSITALASNTETLALNATGTVLTITISGTPTGGVITGSALGAGTTVLGTATAGIRDINGVVMASTASPVPTGTKF